MQQSGMYHPELMDESLDYDDVDDCGNPSVSQYQPLTTVDRDFQVEHIIDGHLIADFIQDASRGVLRSGATATTGPVSVSYFVQARTQPVLQNAPPLTGVGDPNDDSSLKNVYGRIMETVGSRKNDVYFVGLVVNIHRYKTIMLKNKDPMSPAKVLLRITSGSVDDAAEVLGAIRGTIAAMIYLNRQNTPNVKGNLAHVANNIRAQWLHSQTLYNAANPNAPTSVAQFWSKWIKDIFGTGSSQNTGIGVRPLLLS
ncbi:hypothetical protein C7974DRAFT_75046 [Boeremia exigua]|uniref:uncharacterized protein n=1 Tax=Boeremia exigua TaxID=749465 RepID=UPI001E8E623F|nr:uncharacterized protein C7974DRAFT_75046 [Boeremia exigua]KAH6613024.1 hypothetical protein C7974DRAFT_75046 [Boeremia exigua]